MKSLKISKAHHSDKEEVVFCVNSSYKKYISRLGKKSEPMVLDYSRVI